MTHGALDIYNSPETINTSTARIKFEASEDLTELLSFFVKPRFRAKFFDQAKPMFYSEQFVTLHHSDQSHKNTDGYMSEEYDPLVIYDQVQLEAIRKRQLGLTALHAKRTLPRTSIDQHLSYNQLAICAYIKPQHDINNHLTHTDFFSQCESAGLTRFPIFTRFKKVQFDDVNAHETAIDFNEHVKKINVIIPTVHVKNPQLDIRRDWAHLARS